MNMIAKCADGLADSDQPWPSWYDVSHRWLTARHFVPLRHVVRMWLLFPDHSCTFLCSFGEE